MTVAVTGSTGAVGGLVARGLADDFRTDLRLVVRDVSRAPDYDTDVRACEYADEAAAVAALEGVDTLFMVSAAEAVDRRDQHRTFIRAAAAAGVGHIVYTSFAGAAADATFTLGRDHFDAETAIRESGMAYTFLRDNFYADLLPYFADRPGSSAVPPARAGWQPSPGPTWPTSRSPCCATPPRTRARRTP